MGTVIVQGATRGIGLQFCKILAARQDVTILATGRSAEKSQELLELSKEKSNVIPFNMDVTEEEQVQKFAKTVQSQFGSSLDLLINCSAILHPSGKGETSLKDVSGEGLVATLRTNTVGPLLMAKYFSPLLFKGQGRFGSHNENAKHSAVLVNLTAKVGSITENALGGWYSYRMSKSALNMATRNLSIELGRGRSKVICVALHPGTVDTSLSRPYHKGVAPDKLFSAEKSVNHLMAIIDNLRLQDSGKCFSWDGSEIPF